MKNRRIKLKRVGKTPKAATILKQAEPGPMFKGEGTIDFVCAGCDSVLAEGVTRKQIEGMFVTCPLCGATNAFPNTSTSDKPLLH